MQLNSQRYIVREMHDKFISTIMHNVVVNSGRSGNRSKLRLIDEE